jgi:hypothetical protein
MRPISTEGFEKPASLPAGAAPMLRWMKIEDLVVDPAYQRPIIGNGRQNVDHGPCGRSATPRPSRRAAGLATVRARVRRSLRLSRFPAA